MVLQFGLGSGTKVPVNLANDSARTEREKCRKQRTHDTANNWDIKNIGRAIERSLMSQNKDGVVDVKSQKMRGFQRKAEKVLTLTDSKEEGDNDDERQKEDGENMRDKKSKAPKNHGKDLELSESDDEHEDECQRRKENRANQHKDENNSEIETMGEALEMALMARDKDTVDAHSPKMQGINVRCAGKDLTHTESEGQDDESQKVYSLNMQDGRNEVFISLDKDLELSESEDELEEECQRKKQNQAENCLVSCCNKESTSFRQFTFNFQLQVLSNFQLQIGLFLRTKAVI